MREALNALEAENDKLKYEIETLKNEISHLQVNINAYACMHIYKHAHIYMHMYARMHI